MTDLQKEFESTGYTSWTNADLYPDGKIYTQEYTQWLERQVLVLRQPLVSGSLLCEQGKIELLRHSWACDQCKSVIEQSNDCQLAD